MPIPNLGIERDYQSRENIIHAAAIRAALCAARGLSESQACRPPGLHDHFVEANKMVGYEACTPPVCESQLRGATDPARRVDCEWLPSDDSEGGAE